MIRRLPRRHRIVAACTLAAALLGPRTLPAAAEEETAAAATDVAVQVGKITRATVHAYVIAYGMVEAEPANANQPAAGARVASPIAGVVATALAVEGQRVEKGAVLFRLDSRVLDVAVERAKLSVEFAEKAVARQQRLLQAGGTSQKLIEEAQQQLDTSRSELANAQAQRALQTITAPLSGTVVRVHARPGEAVDLTTVLAELVDLQRLVVTANVASGELAALRIGQPAEISPEPAPTTDHSAAPTAAHGTLSRIGTQLDPRTAAAPVRVSLSADSGLRLGQFVRVRILVEERRNRLVVPIESVVKAGDANVIAVVEGDKATHKPVQIGLREASLVEVDGDGLQEGMTVVTTGAYGLPAETKIRILNR